jgi:hypothetical protein
MTRPSPAMASRGFVRFIPSCAYRAESWGLMIITLSVVAIVVGLTLVGAGLWQTFKPKGESIVRSPIVTVQGSTGISIIALGLLCLAGGAYLTYRTSSTQSSATPSTSAISNSSPTPNLPSPSEHTSGAKGPFAILQYPHNGTNVSKSQGFIARGPASYLGVTTIWILDHSGGYTVDQKALISAGSWSATDQPLGDSSNHLPFNLNMVAVFANTTCAQRLKHVMSTSNDYMNHLPAGCQIFGQVTVNVSRS